MIGEPEARATEEGQPMFQSMCPLCWGEHVRSEPHEIVATASREDQQALISELSILGVGWPAEYASDDPRTRAYGLLRMIDDAAIVGFDCCEAENKWVISRSNSDRAMPGA